MPWLLAACVRAVVYVAVVAWLNEVRIDIKLAYHLVNCSEERIARAAQYIRHMHAIQMRDLLQVNILTQQI